MSLRRTAHIPHLLREAEVARRFGLVLLLLLLLVAPGALHGQTSEPVWGRGGFVPVFGGLGQTAGITAGLRYDAFLRHPNYTMLADAIGSVRGYAGVRAVGGFENDLVAAYAFGRYRYLPKEIFYGFGAESDLDDGGDYRIDDRLIGLSAAFKPGNLLATGMHLSLQDYRFGDGREGDVPPIHELHDVRGIGEDARYMTLGVWMELDGRVFTHPRRLGYRFAPVEPQLRGMDLGVSQGWYLAAEVAPHIGTRDGGADFLRADVEGQLYVPTGFGPDGFAFRALMIMTSFGDEPPPFYMLPALGGASSIRGFRPDRFRDEHAFLVNAEYRRGLLLFLDAAVFVDAGQTFGATSDVSLGDMEFGYGLGLRTRVGRFVLGRLDLARSREGFRVYLRAGTFL